MKVDISRYCQPRGRTFQITQWYFDPRVARITINSDDLDEPSFGGGLFGPIKES